MTYELQKVRIGRKPISIVELDLDFCSLEYGVAPCTAALGVTGTSKCYRARKHCQDSANYSPAARTYRFSDRVVNDLTALPLFASLKSVATTPTKIDPGRALGERATCTATFQDHPDSDTFTDPYYRTRSYVPQNQGTFWGKLLARNPFYQGRVMRVRTGYWTEGEAFTWDDFETRTYFIDQISGPDASGKVKITGKDILKIVDDAKAVAPVANTGMLSADLTAISTSANLIPAGIGDEEYEASGIMACGQELMSFTRIADALIFVRGIRGTTATTHDEEDILQQCLHYEDMTVQDIMLDLLTVQGTIDPSYCDTASWDDEVDTWLSSYTLDGLIIKPTGITALLQELSEQALFYIWWDERAALLLGKAIRPARSTEITFINEDEHILQNSLNITEEPKHRLSAVDVRFDRNNPIQDEKKISNYRKGRVSLDDEAEGAHEFGERIVKQIFSRWIPSTGSALADTLGFRLLSKFRENPKKVVFKLDAKDSSLWTGDIFNLTSKQLQGPDGAPFETQMQVMQVHETVLGSVYEYECARSFFQHLYAFITPDDEPDYTDASAEQQARYGWICGNDGFLSNGDEGQLIV